MGQLTTAFTDRGAFAKLYASEASCNLTGGDFKCYRTEVDLFELFGIEFLSDRIEDRYGRRAAFCFALSAGVVLVGALVVLFVLFQR